MTSTAESQKVLVPKIGDWNVLCRWGIVQLDVADHYSRYAHLPTGWAVVPGPSSFHDYLIDDRGLRRAVFIKKPPFSADEDDHFNVYPERFIVANDYSHKFAKAYLVKDLGLGRIIRRFEGGHYAIAIDQPTVVGFVYQNRFFFEPVGNYTESRFSQEADGTVARVISEDDFYAIHRRSPLHSVIGAAEFIAQQEAIAFIKSLNESSDPWASCYDFPALPDAEG